MADKRENCEASEGNSYSDPNETDDEEVEGRPQEKRTKFAGAPIYKTKFNKDWVKKYPFISALEKNTSSYCCNICCRILSCSHQGESDVKRHVASNSHVQFVKVQSKQRTLTSMFAAKSSDIKDKVIIVYFIRYELNY